MSSTARTSWKSRCDAHHAEIGFRVGPDQFRGINATVVHPRVVRFHKLAADRGVLVMEVEPSSPAALAGVAEGDTVVGFKGHAIATIDDLQKQLSAEEIGLPSPIMFLRGTEKRFAMVVPRELPPFHLRQSNLTNKRP